MAREKRNSLAYVRDSRSVLLSMRLTSLFLRPCLRAGRRRAQVCTRLQSQTQAGTTTYTATSTSLIYSNMAAVQLKRQNWRRGRRPLSPACCADRDNRLTALFPDIVQRSRAPTMRLRKTPKTSRPASGRQRRSIQAVCRPQLSNSARRSGPDILHFVKGDVQKAKRVLKEMDQNGELSLRSGALTKCCTETFRVDRFCRRLGQVASCANRQGGVRPNEGS